MGSFILGIYPYDPIHCGWDRYAHSALSLGSYEWLIVVVMVGAGTVLFALIGKSATGEGKEESVSTLHFS